METQDVDTTSGLGGATINPQKVARRSFRSNSDVRHGRLYDDPRESVRLVTPDPTPATTSDREEVEVPSSPPRLLPYRSQSSFSMRDNSASVSNTDEESTGISNKRKSQKKSKAGDEVPGAVATSPGSFLTKTRTRIGSINTKSGRGRQTDEARTTGRTPVVEPVPTTTAVPVKSHESRPRSPRRTTSSDTAAALGARSTIRSPLALSTDSQRILNLMKTTCGRMHGILFFRPIGTSPWESGYCAINVAPGSLVCQKQGELSSAKVLLSDLRGCSVRTNYDAETQNVYISVVLASSGQGYQLRPPVPETFDSWLAALLCWQPLRPKGIHNKLTKGRSIGMAEKRPVSQRQTSDTTITKSAAVVKIGRMLVWDGPLPVGSQRHVARRQTDFESLPPESPWRRVSCALHENGTFRLLTEVTGHVVMSIQLSELARCAVQRLDKSVLDVPHCLAIYLHYTSTGIKSRISRPLVLGLETKNAYEAWFVLLRTLTAPELYGPDYNESQSQGNTPAGWGTLKSSTFRIERSLSVKVTEAKLNRPLHHDEQLSHRSKSGAVPRNADLYADIILGSDLRARTMPKKCESSAFWAEDFAFPDLPTTMSTISIAIKVGNPTEQEWSMIAHEDYDATEFDATRFSALDGIEIASHDPDYGRVDIQMDDLEQENTMERWWEMCDKHGRAVGTILVRFALSETIVLMDSEYGDLAALLHTIDNGLTPQIALSLGQELKTVSERLLDIFQAANAAQEWIYMLVEEEIDGVNKENAPVRMRFSGRVHSNDSYDVGQQREALVRDLSRSATVEANLLFRGNSLVTKALDAHMRRLGTDYLEKVLGDKLRRILSQNLDCEVDPSRVRFPEQLGKNWTNLNNVTIGVWKLIASSATDCPPALRMIFKHIASCADDRYGSFIRTVKYTSVSGFLFLRFFCPAILNPRLFGLIEDHPPDRARRTFTLVAKSLNVLASMAKFGTKETWMEPMNRFLLAATPEFKTFIDEICSISSSEATEVLDPQFLAPLQIRARLAQSAREGLPTLPYLLDPPQSLAALVELWVKHNPTSSPVWANDVTMRMFHQMCLDLHTRTQDCLNQAEPAQKPDRNLEPQWQQLLNHQQRTGGFSINPFEDSFRGAQSDQEITALPQRAEPLKIYSGITNGTIQSSTMSSISLDGRRLASAPPNLAFSTSANSSTLSFEAPADARKGIASREAQPKGRIFDYLKPVRRRNKADKPSLEHDYDGP